MTVIKMYCVMDETLDDIPASITGKSEPQLFETVIARVRAENWQPNVQAVKLRGEPLSTPVYWLGEQWSVTSHGIEKRDGTYEIEHTRLLHIGHNWDWCTHLSSKYWFDIRDFAVAYETALLKFKHMTISDFKLYRRKLRFQDVIG